MDELREASGPFEHDSRHRPDMIRPLLSDALVRMILDSLDTGVLLLSRPDRRHAHPMIVWANQMVATLTGFALVDLIGARLRRLRAAEPTDPSFASLLAAMGAGEPWSGELPITLADGGLERLQATGVPLADAEHHLLMLGPSLRHGDKREPLLARVSRILGDLVSGGLYQLVADLDGGLRLDWSDHMIERVTGYDLPELMARGGLAGLAVQADRVRIRRRNLELLAGVSNEIIYRIATADGRIVRVVDRARPVRTGTASPVESVVGTLRIVEADRSALRPTGLARSDVKMLADLMGATILAMDGDVNLLWAANGRPGPLPDALAELASGALDDVLGQDLSEEWRDRIEQALTTNRRVESIFHWPAAGERWQLALEPLSGETVLGVVRPERTIHEALPLDEAMARCLRRLPIQAVMLDATLHLRAVGGGLIEPRSGEAGASFLDSFVPSEAWPAMERALEQIVQGAAMASAMAGCRDGTGSSQPGSWSLLRLGELEPARFLAIFAPDPSGGQGHQPPLERVLDHVADGIVVLDERGLIEWISRSAEEIFDLPRDLAVGMPVGRLLAGGVDGADDVTSLLARDSGTSEERAARRASGELVPIEIAISRLGGAEGQGTILTVRDITLKKQTEETIRNLAYSDPLTGLPNRLLFLDRLNQAIERSRRNRQQLAVMLVDLDRFKLINDSLGLEKGDQIIRAVGKRIRDSLRKSDTVARFGGDEFLILALATDSAEAAAKVAQKATESLQAPIRINGHELTVGASVGISLYPIDGESADQLLKNADTALHRAKDHGRNHYQFYTTDMNAKAYQRLVIETRLRRAVERNELSLHYQPQVGLADGRLVGVEALLRWHNAETGLIPPSDFIPIAEETGLILPIGEWVLRQAIEQMRIWHAEGLDGLRIAVNISARQFQAADFVSKVRRMLVETSYPGRCLELELTESSIMRDVQDTVHRLQELTELGIRVTVDDFGTGYSSLAYLKRFPIGALKIDRSFVSDVTTDPNDAAIARAVVAMAEALRVKVVAEGVETREQLEFMRELGCDEAQGYFISRPIPAAEALAWMRAAPKSALG